MLSMCVCTYVCVCAYVYTCVCMYVCMHVCMYVCIYVYIYVCTVFIRIKAGLKYTQDLKYTLGSAAE